MAVLVTGAAGFIGAATSRMLLERGDEVAGIDNLNDYYDPALKQARLTNLERQFGDRFRFQRIDFSDAHALNAFADTIEIDGIVHLGAQAGVRYSLKNPQAYVQSNLVGHTNMLELARARRPRHMVYASSSSVYGGNKSLPFRVEDRVDHPLSLYAATKKADELLSESYSSLYRLALTGLRFFTVYGPWGRPDMAMYIFAKAITDGHPIRLFNRGEMRRDFTYIDDVTEAIERIIAKIPVHTEQRSSRNLDPSTSTAPWRIYNIGNNRSVEVPLVVSLLEKELGHTAKIELAPMQPGDVPETRADVDDLMRDVGFRPATLIEDGVRKFVDWYREYHQC